MLVSNLHIIMHRFVSEADDEEGEDSFQLYDETLSNLCKEDIMDIQVEEV